MIRSTFAGFTSAQLAMSASQRALDVTGQNIANINTAGYTRQRLDLASISPNGASYSQMANDCRVGQGVLMTGITQIRDPFLDIQYRSHLAQVGTVDAQDSVLAQIGKIFDEVDKTAIRNDLSNVISQLNNMATPDNANQGASDTLVRSAMETLLNAIHGNANQLKDVRNDLIKKLESTDVEKINGYLKSISELNKSIKNSQVLGSPALELQDERNDLIDQLATYLPINVTYYDQDLGSGYKVDALKITFKDTGTPPTEHVLIDDAKYGSVKFDSSVSPMTFKITDKDGAESGDLSSLLGDGVLKGSLDALNKSGGAGDDFKGIGYYEKLFDSFVNTFATTLNNLNKAAGGKALFKTTDGRIEGFTASNIKISDNWMSGDTKIVTSTVVPVPGSTKNETAYENVLKMINSLNNDTLNFKDKGGNSLFKGTVFEAYDNIQNTQAIERQSTSSILRNRTGVLNQIANSKDSVSGVYLDEEVMNLMRYQQSYNAAARLMTTLDEALNTLINNTGTVGR